MPPQLQQVDIAATLAKARALLAAKAATPVPVSSVSSIEEKKDASVVATAPAPLSEIDQISARISELQLAISSSLPGYERMLQTIHSALSKSEATCHLLTEEQVGIICEGLAKKKNIVIVEKITKKKTRSLKNIDINDL